MAGPKTPSRMTDADKGAAVYFSWFLNHLYDPIILGLYCSVVWRCPTSTQLLPFFNHNITNETSRIFDIGVGTGYYLTRMKSAPNASITLLDLNSNCLQTASTRIKHAHPDSAIRPVQANVLDEAALDATKFPNTFQAVSLMFLLHCLPQPVSSKGAMLQRLAHLVDPKDGVLFGCTVLGKNVAHSLLGRLVMWWHNAQGVFDNYDDSVKSIVDPLKDAFEQVEWRVVGAVLLFEARKPRKSA